MGQPISNELNTRILIEYLKGIGDVEGWILLNYPNTYEQMAMLEKILTGREISPDLVNLTDVNIESIDSSSPRIIFESDEVDTFAIYRRVRSFHVEIILDFINNMDLKETFNVTNSIYIFRFIYHSLVL